MPDVLETYRFSQPLTSDEKALLNIESLKTTLIQSGVIVQQRGPGTYLAFTQVRDRGNIARVMKIVAQLQLVALKQLGSAGAFRMILRLALAVSQDTDKRTLACIFGLAMRLYELEQPAEALLLFRQAWVSYQEVLGETDPKTLSCLNNQANCLAELGRFTEALPLHQQVVALRCSGDPESRLPETLVSLSGQAHCLMKLGRSTEALPLYRTVVASCRQVFEENHRFLFSTLNGLALCLEGLGLYDDALPLYREALAGLQKIFPEGHQFILKSQGNLASCLNRQGRSVEALQLHQKVLALRQKNLPPHHPDIPLGVNNLACCLEGLSRFDEALSLHKKALVLREGTLGDCHPLTLASMNNVATNLMNLGRSVEALSILRTLAFRIADHPSLTKEWPARVWAIACTFEKVIKNTIFDWSTPFQALSRAWVEVLDLQSPEQVALLRNPFQQFHRLYLQLCIDHHRSDLLPSIVAAIQGRRLAAILLEELTERVADEIAEDAPLRDRVLALRRRLRFAALDLRVLDGGLSRNGVMDGSLRGFQGDSDEHATQRQQLAEYADLFQRYHQLQQELVKNDPDFALVSPVLDIDLAKLQEKLATDEALVLLLDWPDAESPKLFSLVVKSKTHRLFALPEALLALPAQFDALGQVQTARLGVRHSAMRSSSPISSAITAPITLGEIVAVLEQHFWGTLALELTEIKTVHVVTHGDFHVLPFSAAADPNRWRAFTYPGLIFYQHQHYQRQTSQGLAEKPTSATPLVVQSYSAMDHPAYPPIPMVDAEAELVTALWPNAVSTLIPNDASIAVLHLAGHGHYASNDPLSAGVLLADATVDCRVVFKSGLRPQIVVLSACVVGRTHEADGEPLGLATAFLLRGARFVIAPLQPINDCMMPLLVCLFYQAWRDGRTPPQALTEAKRRLSSGDWYPDTAQRVRSAYKNTLNAYLAILLNEPHAHRQYQLLETFRQWPLPDPYKSDGRNLLLRRLQSERGIERFIDAFLNYIEIHRAELPVVDLVTSVVGFGG